MQVATPAVRATLGHNVFLLASVKFTTPVGVGPAPDGAASETVAFQVTCWPTTGVVGDSVTVVALGATLTVTPVDPLDEVVLASPL